MCRFNYGADFGCDGCFWSLCLRRGFLTGAASATSPFADASSFTEAPIALTDDQREQIKKIAGVGQRQAVQKAWRVENNGALLGWFMVDDVIGKHDFITYAAAISAQGKVLGIEILSYRETHGGQFARPIGGRISAVKPSLTDLN